jgi:GT2 family glycosyltransferase
MFKNQMDKEIVNPKVAYIIVSWNNENLLKDCIESVILQDYPNKTIILVDNDSKDNSVSYVRASFPEVNILEQSDNLGFAKGNNLGIAKAFEDTDVAYVVLLNTDARLAIEWTSVLVKATRIKPRAAILQSVTLDYYNHDIIDSTHVYIAQNGQGTQGSWRRYLPYGYDVGLRKVFGCNAAAMLITRKFIEEQPFKDFFDETMFMYLEDVDVAARATVMGWDNYVVPGTRAFHMGSISASKKDPSFSLYMTFRNNTGLLIKNLPTKLLFRVLLHVIAADRAAINHLRRIGNEKAIPAIIKGRLKSLLYIPIFILKRRKLKSCRVVDEDYLWNLMRRGF